MLTANGTANSEHRDWHPRIRLRDLRGVYVHLNSSQVLEYEAGYCYVALWTLLKQGRWQDEAKCLTVSHQVPLEDPVTFVPLELLNGIDTELLHSISSGCVHLHVYACQTYSIDKPQLISHVSKHSQQRKAKPPPKSPLHEPETESSDSEPSSESTFKSKARSRLREDSAHLVGFKQQKNPEPESLPSLSLPLCQQAPPATACISSCEMTESSLCSSAQLPGQLLLALTIDIAALPFKRASISKDRSTDSSLTFQFTDDRQAAWPPEEIKEVTDSSIENPQQSHTESEPVGGLGGAWRALFRRGGQARASENSPQESQPSDSSTSLSAQEQAQLRNGNQATNASSNSLPSGTSALTEISYNQLEESIQLLGKLQTRADFVQAQTAMATHKLLEAIKMRERSLRQMHRLELLQDELMEKKERVIAAKKQTQAVKSSCKTARHLMQNQTDHLTIACSRLEDYENHLEGPAKTFHAEIRKDWLQLLRRLVARRCRLAADLQSIFNIQPKTVSVLEPPQTGFLWHRLEHGWSEVPLAARPKSSIQQAQDPTAATSQSREPSEAAYSTTDTGDAQSIFGGSLSEDSTHQTRPETRIAIGSLHLEPSLSRQNSEGLVTGAWQSEQEQDEQLTAALGYTVHVLNHLADYLGVALKYPLHPANSRSSIFGCQEGVRQQAQGEREDSNGTVNGAQDEVKPVEYALDSEKIAPARFTHALYLLNKDMEQLLSMHDLSSAGSPPLLQQLDKLLNAGSSAVPAQGARFSPHHKVPSVRHDGKGHFSIEN